MARSPLDIHTLLVIRQAGRWLRKMRHGRRACPAGSGVRRVIGGPAVSLFPSRFFGVSRAVPDRLRAIAESGLCRWDDASPRKNGGLGPGIGGATPPLPRVPAKGATVGQLARLAVRLRALPLLRSRFSWLFLPISPGRSLRSPRRVPGDPVPVPVLSARRGRSSVLPVRPDGTGGSSRRRRPEGASPACGAQSRPARDGCAGSTALPVPLSPPAASVPLCRSVQGEACEALDGCRAILSRSRCCRLGGADPRSCRSGQTARVGRAAEGAPKGQAPLAGRSLGPHGTAVPGQRLCRCLSLLLRPLCRSADQSRAKPAKP